MKIEVLVRWVELSQVQAEQDDLSSILNEEESQQSQMKLAFDYTPMVLDVNDIGTFNASGSAGHTTLRMKNGEGFVIKKDYLEFVALYTDFMSCTITSLLPEDYTFPTPKEDGTDGLSEDGFNEDDGEDFDL